MMDETKKKKSGKNIILLSDGTGNSAASPHKTNVWRMYQAIELDDSAKKQIAFYDDGVGTSSFILTRLIGKALGWGVARNVLDLYKNLCRVYEKDDQIYIFGFSRGAFTARVLAALIGSQGIMKYQDDEAKLESDAKKAFKDFHIKSFSPSLISNIIHFKYKQQKFDELVNDEENRYFARVEKGEYLVKFLGVWDTVDAYGAPIDEMTRAWDKIIWPLSAKDRDLSAAVRNAFHALALDEQRESFEPMLWNEKTEYKEGVQPPKIEQVWFPGVHANVGGGYPDDGLAHVSLHWMMKRAENLELVFKQGVLEKVRKTANPLGPLYNNRSGLGNFYRYDSRRLETLCHEEKKGLIEGTKARRGRADAVINCVEIDRPKIHHTVFDRINGSIDGYAPINLPKDYEQVDDDGNKITGQEHEQVLAIETPEQATIRRLLQGKLWWRVWLMKAIYAVTVCLGLVLAVFPYLTLGDATSNAIGQISKFGRLLGFFRYLIGMFVELISKIPGLGFLEGWTNAWSNYPFVFVLLIVLVGVLIKIAFSLQKGLHNEMLKIWGVQLKHSRQITPQPFAAWKRKLVDSWLDRTDNKNVINYSIFDKLSGASRFLLELICTLLLIFVLVFVLFWGFSKVAYTGRDGLGYNCQPSDKVDTYTIDKNRIRFDPKVPCLDTGFDLKEGHKYVLNLSLPRQYWMDDNIPADVYGLRNPIPPLMYLAIPWRRHMGVAWFAPVARIGNTWFEYHWPKKQFDNEEQGNNDFPTYNKSFTIVPSHDGRLYLYVNDAITWPFQNIDEYYKNNCAQCGAESTAPNAIVKLEEIIVGPFLENQEPKS